ncbi:MAG: DNA translocase FtsK [Bacillota bacterium]|jgi:S-DNA-T family DNA segregation ATPase FtsK/SpoIIIE|nr:DNA translocase FtsK [Bacillota bacterium]NLL25877.1 DNA translocase FtsK [Erysipelotrichia bacterium]
MTKKRKTKRNKSTRRYTKEELKVLRITYGVILVSLGFIGLLYQQTAFLGEFLFKVSRYLFGKCWFVSFVVMIVAGLCTVFKFTFGYKYLVSGVAVFLSVLIFLSIPKDKSVGFDLINNFFANSKAIFTGTVTNDGGLTGTFLYSLFSSVLGYMGIYIVETALIILSVVIHFDFADKDFDQIKDDVATYKKQRREEKAKRKEELLKEKEKKKQLEKEKKLFIDNDSKNKEPDRQQIVSVAKEIVSKPDTLDGKGRQIEVLSLDLSSPTQKIVYNEKNYKLPGIDKLDTYSISKKSSINNENAKVKWEELSEVLESFGYESKLEGVNIGPSVTQFEVSPIGNFNIRRYASIEENIKMSLAVTDLRIVAPIPGKSAVGFEIPNVERTAVRLSELLKNIKAEHKKNPLTIALGKDITGNNVYASIDKLPHLLIAGATGMGKSVCINSIILTILMNARPSDVKLVLVDPKKVEFTKYKEIPHLACPIITDNADASEVLKKLCILMDERYEMFSKMHVNSIKDYNASEKTTHKMCNIICIIDELSDLMATHRKEIEIHIQRLSAKARAAGIYLILATQRPSADVITGVIKANIPSRIAFKVASSIDSRVILDCVGAESLLNNGDMLFMQSGSTSLERIQGVYASNQEIARVVSYLSDSGYIPQYEDIFMIDDDDSEDLQSNVISCNNDPLYGNIKSWVVTQKTVSASGLQRRYSLGFPRAAKFIDCLEQEGIISGPKGSRPRDVLARIELE